ncbi:MAG: UDP-galactopyranose mutase [Silvanigrellales bacterium]|jgi:UDP-galactopyranose mutase|nr:UDP-galactopyranose mutase [Silvanigrellales bacterium]
MRHKKEIGIAGAGFAGAVLARELAESGKYEVVVFDERRHVAGNCHTARDAETGVMVHAYGPHIFHTSREDVWSYVNKFARFRPFTNRVKAVTARGLFTLPVNLLTINQFFGKSMRPWEAREFIASLGDRSMESPRNFEEQALKFLGRELYENFFYGYTKKQWGVEPSCLPASILQRLPVRFNYDDNYYASRYQGIPEQGYTALVENLLDHPGIHVRLGERFDPAYTNEFSHVFYSGPMDGFFQYEFGKLQYRSLNFERISEKESVDDFQGNAVINYCEESVPYTRITEHKHFAPWEEHKGTVCFREFSKLAQGDDTPYYPLRLESDKDLLLRYEERAESQNRVTFIGRLGTYRYLDMHVVIGESIDLAAACLANETCAQWPRFSRSRT